MKEYKIIQTNQQLRIFDNEQEVRATDILTVYPTRRVYAFHGQMGAGKTTFIKLLCEEMGIIDIVNSPTFAIVNEYNCPNSIIYHFDCYRLQSEREALDFGAEEYLYSGNYCFIEWPEMIENLLPKDLVNINIEVIDNYTRILHID